MNGDCWFAECFSCPSGLQAGTWVNLNYPSVHSTNACCSRQSLREQWLFKTAPRKQALSKTSSARDCLADSYTYTQHFDLSSHMIVLTHWWRTGRVRMWRDRGRSCETFCLYFALQNVEGLASAAIGNQYDRQWIHWDDTKRSWHCNNFRTGSPANGSSASTLPAAIMFQLRRISFTQDMTRKYMNIILNIWR